MRANLGGWLLYVAVVAGVIFIGWHEPLSYRFKSKEEIHVIEHPVTPPPAAAAAAPTPKPGSWIYDPAKSPLDGKRK